MARYDFFEPDTSEAEDRSTIYMLGVNYHFNSWVKIQASYGIRTEEGPAIDNNIGAVQLQMAF